LIIQLIKILLVVLLFLPSQVLAVDYYFSTSGSDGNPCTEVSPCQQIDKFNSLSLVGGDNVYFNKGDTWNLTNGHLNNVMNPESGVSIVSPVTIGAYGSGALPTFDGEDHPDWDNAIYVGVTRMASYITIQDLKFVGFEHAAIITGGYVNDHIKIQRCTFDHTGAGVGGNKASYWTIDSNTFSDLNRSSAAGFTGTLDDTSHDISFTNNILSTTGFNPSDAITIHEQDQSPFYNIGPRWLIKGNTMNTNADENELDLTAGSYIVVDDNDISTGPSSQLMIYLGDNPNDNQYTRFSNNTIHDATNAGAPQLYIGNDSDYTQIIRNVFYGTGEHLFTIYSDDDAETFDGIHAAHNVFDMRGITGGAGFEIGTGGSPHGAILDMNVKNNIFVQDADYYSVNWRQDSCSDSDYVFDYNMYYDTSTSPADFWEGSISVTEMDSSCGQEDNGAGRNGGLEGNPLFTNLGSRHYTQKAGSPAINAGGWLTTITTCTDATHIVVVDPRWFFDGWGIYEDPATQSNPLVGDTIKTENGYSAIISSINYGTGAMVLAGGGLGSCTPTEGLALDYNGSAPDIGAHEYSYAVEYPVSAQSSSVGSGSFGSFSGF